MGGKTPKKVSHGPIACKNCKPHEFGRYSEDDSGLSRTALWRNCFNRTSTEPECASMDFGCGLMGNTIGESFLSDGHVDQEPTVINDNYNIALHGDDDGDEDDSCSILTELLNGKCIPIMMRIVISMRVNPQE